jgi:hypothetical protein
MPGIDEDTAKFVIAVRESDSRKATLNSLASGPATPDELDQPNINNIRKILEELLEHDTVSTTNSKFELTDFGERILEYATKDWNPSNKGTKRSQTFEILSDCKWHCSSCELPSSQPAKDIQMLRKEGFEFVQNTGQGQGDYMHCDNCESTTFHRKMKYPFPTSKPIVRQDMPDWFKQKVRDIYDYKDAFDGSSPSTTLEVDHRVPEVRWEESEDFDYESMSEDDIQEHFQILSRKHNLLKSRKCEQCVETGERPSFMQIDYYYKGDEDYDDEMGCEGCGWYNPHKWRSSLEAQLD